MKIRHQVLAVLHEFPPLLLGGDNDDSDLKGDPLLLDGNNADRLGFHCSCSVTVPIQIRLVWREMYCK